MQPYKMWCSLLIISAIMAAFASVTTGSMAKFSSTATTVRDRPSTTKGYRHLKFHSLHNLNKVKHTDLSLTSSSADLSSSDPCQNITLFYFKDAVVDNFSPIENQETWYGNGQRYWVNPMNWGGPGYPVFVYIGGEGEESCSTLTDWSLMYTLSQQHKALLVDIEHRFYGESYPTSDMSTENLSYLSSQQALADLARLVTHVKNQYDTKDSEVITFGGSYPGNMAAWFRLKYPSITLGSVGSSAPLTAQTNFSEYMDVVAQAMVYYAGQECYDAFESAANTVAANGAAGPGSPGMLTLEQDFSTCAPIDSDLDYATFLSDLMGNVQGTCQYNTERAGAMTVASICATMLAGPDPYTQFIALNEQYLESYNQSCWDVSWDNLVAYVANPVYDPTNAYRPWVYQTCNEFGYFQTADSLNQPFHSWAPLNVNYSMELCFQCYDGWADQPEVAWSNTVYGGVNISGTNIVFPAGTIDPWHALGVTNATKATLPESTEQSVYILGTAHCQDMYAPSSTDTPPLAAAKVTIQNVVGGWLTGAAVVPPVVPTENGCACDDDNEVETYQDTTYAVGGAAALLLLIVIVQAVMICKLKNKSGLNAALNSN